jgi:NAD(P)-dependent dehydrogenase (short-subunit alcohol dehydrogenase family)
MDSVTQPLALVIGGTGAIGTAIVDRLAKRGRAVVATYRHQERPVRDGETTWAPFDAKEPATAAAMAEAVRVDGRPLRTLIYAAGVGSTKRTVVDTPLDEFEQLWQANALGFVAVWQAVAELTRAGGASVLVISSDAARTAGSRNGPYSASKAALETIALTLAKEEAAYGVRVNVMSPSLVASPMAETMLRHKGIEDAAEYYAALPFGRALETGEVAELAVDIAVGEHWRYASGQIVRLAADVGR